jgi:hypothetical protein
MAVLGARLLCAPMLLIAACGRIHFEPLADPDAAVVHAACNTPLDLGALTDIRMPGIASGWLAAASVPAGVVVVYASSDGVGAFTLTPGEGTLARGPTVAVGGPVTDNLQAVASGDRLFVTYDGGATTAISIRDFALGRIGEVSDTSVSISAPDHSAPRLGGGIVMAGTSTVVEASAFDRDGGFVTTNTWPLSMPRGGSIAALSSGGYVGTWYSAADTCEIRVLDESLIEQDYATIASCQYLRAAEAGDRIALTWSDPANQVFASMATRTLARTPEVALIMAAPQSPRLAASDRGAWTLAPSSSTTLAAVRVDTDGVMRETVTLGPYAVTTIQFVYDVVIHAGEMYAVWVDFGGGASLHASRVCAD